jgi:leucyl aminopeptidase
MDIEFVSQLKTDHCIVLAVGEDKSFSTQMKNFDNDIGGFISKSLAANNFKGEKGEQLFLTSLSEEKVINIIVLGLGKDALLANDMVALGGKITAALKSYKITEASIILDYDAEMLAHVAQGMLLRDYTFDKYKTKKEQNKKKPINAIRFVTANSASAQEKFRILECIARGVYLTRDLVTEPPNVIYPETLAAKCQELTKLGVDVEVLSPEDMQKLGMGALLGVAQGSIRSPRLVVMKWNGLAKGDTRPPVAFVGKGVTFDTGGISLKPASGMEDMKYDMAGSAVVIGLMKALAERSAKVNVVGIVGLVENMPGGKAQRPSDVVTSMSGQTIEVLNTDAEGRLVLADALWYCQDRFKPECIIDLATLTGAIVVTFGSLYAGLFTNNEQLCDRLLNASKKVDERVWRMPLDKIYDKQIDSQIADVQNIGSEKGAGSVTAAQFLQRFVNNVPWAHLDIAGVAWTTKDKDITPKGATAFGVRLLNQFLQDNYG